MILLRNSDDAKKRTASKWRRAIDTARKLGPSLVIPFRHTDGSFNGFSRIRPDHPREADGKPCRYEQPKGVSPQVYWTREALDAIQHAARPFFLGGTEGEKKAVAAALAGIPDRCRRIIGNTARHTRSTPKKKFVAKPAKVAAR